MLAPEPARAAALGGADLLVWLRPPSSSLDLAFARTRAMENRMYLLLCSTRVAAAIISSVMTGL
jgi:predicted amidohydrolase